MCTPAYREPNQTLDGYTLAGLAELIRLSSAKQAKLNFFKTLASEQEGRVTLAKGRQGF
jgi:hypothetical protein